jgi:hypothetical protein
MDDFYLIHPSKQYLLDCMDEIKYICAGLGIIVNEKKTRITKLKDGVKFLKGIYPLNENGKIIRRADPESHRRERRKLKKFRGLVGRGRMSYSDVYTAYQSWRNNYLKRFNAYHTVKRMDALYKELFIYKI